MAIVVEKRTGVINLAYGGRGDRRPSIQQSVDEAADRIV